MKSWGTNLNSVRAVALIVWGAVICAMFVPTFREGLLRTAFIMGGVLVGQLFLHARGVDMNEEQSDAEKTRLHLG